MERVFRSGSVADVATSAATRARLLSAIPQIERLPRIAIANYPIRLVRVISDGGASGTSTSPTTWTYSVYSYLVSDTPPDPLPAPLATGRSPYFRATVNGIGAWTKAPDWSVAIAEFRVGLSGNDQWRLLVVDERLPIVVCDPGA